MSVPVLPTDEVLASRRKIVDAMIDVPSIATKSPPQEALRKTLTNPQKAKHQHFK